MSEGARKVGMSAEAFIDWEGRQADRYEFLGGVIRMMVGGTVGHSALGFNLAVLLRGALAGRGCSVFPEGLKLRVPAGDVLYPDVMVVCAPLDPGAGSVSEPALIAEVLSPSTEAVDRGRKWLSYQTLESLRHSLLVHQTHWCVELYTRRTGHEVWAYHRVEGAGAAVMLTAFDLSLPLDDLYEGIQVPVEEETPRTNRPMPG